MSGFEKQLEEEMAKRGIEPVAKSQDDSDEGDAELDSTQTQKRQKKQKSKKESKGKKIFSFAAFFQFLGLGFLLFGALTAWAAFQAEDTLQKVQEKLPSKTAIVTRNLGASGEQQQARLTMQPVVKKPAETINETPLKTEQAKDPAKPQETNMSSSGASSVNSTKKDTLKRNKNGLVPAPVVGLFEASDDGVLPVVRASDKLTAFEAYKRPFKRDSNKALLSVVITDVGVSKSKLAAIVKGFSPDVTLAFSPYAADIKTQIDMVREDGHEVWLTLPMETKEYPLHDPGPSTLLLNASVSQNKRRLDQTLSSAAGYAGVVTQKGHRFRPEDATTNPSIKEIFERGVAIVDSSQSTNNFVARLAERENYPTAQNNFWLDDDLAPAALNRRIRQIIDYGQINKSVVVMMRPYPASLKAIQKLLKSEAAKDFQLAPLSAQVK